MAKTEQRQHDIKKNIIRAFELPKEIILNLPVISLTGNEEFEIENYKGIIEYTEEKVRISVNGGTLRLEGKSLLLKQITSENILIAGKISKIEWLT